jgi:hypothetical protein
MAEQTNFIIPKDGYLTFDALTMKQFIKDRLNETKVFTDQNFEGSYLSTIIEIQSYLFHVLLYYLNRTSTEGMFSEAQLYENMNRIVKLLDYKPIGKQTSTLTFEMSTGTSLNPGLYTIPRYSYLENGTKSFSFNEDIVFSKTEPFGVSQSLSDISKQKLLYQGKYAEYPIYTAAGNDNEVIFFAPGDNVLVDHFNVDVYVYSNNIWTQWSKTPSLYLEDAFAEKFEIRLNENKRYEIKFGNDVNGKKLQPNDQVAIYYLESNGSSGEVGVNAISRSKIGLFSTNTYNSIINDIVVSANEQYTIVTAEQAKQLTFSNSNISTSYQAEESSDNIRQNAPGVFRSQYRLVTEDDYQVFVKTNFANLIHDVVVVNNWAYLIEHLRYYYENVGLKDPNNVSNILYNQLNFADGCNFNNVYMTIVPKTISNTKNPTSSLTSAQKELILSTIKSVKTLTSEIIILDPVYIATDIVIPLQGNNPTIQDSANTKLVIEKDPNSRRDDTTIQQDVYNVFLTYFDRNNIFLGGQLDLNALTSSILSVNGVKTFYTQRTDNPNVRYNGLSMLMWNPIYTTDMEYILKNTTLSYFKFLFLQDKENFVNKITVTSTTTVYENIEY